MIVCITRRCGFPLATALPLLLFLIRHASIVALPEDTANAATATAAAANASGNNSDNHDDDNGGVTRRNNNITSGALEEALKLKPPVATMTDGGDIEGTEWWNEHDSLLRSAWDEWDEQQRQRQRQTRGSGGENSNTDEHQQEISIPVVLPSLDASLIDADLRSAMDPTKTKPTLGHEAIVHRAWEEVLTKNSESAIAIADSKSKSKSNNDDDDSNHHRVYRYENFLTIEGIRKLRNHLDLLSNNGIPKRRPNAMNRNGLLLDPSVPGGVSGDPELHNFVELLAGDYLRPLGRSFFPSFAGEPRDDAEHYAFTIRYGGYNLLNNNHDPDAIVVDTTRAKTTTTTTAVRTSNNTDWDLKEHSDASVYTLNINLNLPEEDYSGSSLYFVAQDNNINLSNNSSNGTTTTTKQHRYREISFEPGTALLHRGMTKHGARPLESGKRNNLVIWLHGIDGYVRIAPYDKDQRLSLQERWSTVVSTTESKETPNKNAAAAAAILNEIKKPKTTNSFFKQKDLSALLGSDPTTFPTGRKTKAADTVEL